MTLGADELAMCLEHVNHALWSLTPDDKRTVLRAALDIEDRDANARLECKACADEAEGRRNPWHTCPERRVP